MKRSTFTLILATISICIQAQFYNSGSITNKDAVISDWETQWFNTTSGVYTGMAGAFEHYGPSSQTFVNNGTYTGRGRHIDQFSGPLGVNGAQEIAGNMRPLFDHLIFANGALYPINITNTDGVNVRGLLNFNNGITTTPRAIHQAGALRFEDTASYVGGNTDAQHVNGYVSKIGNNSFIFPIGSAFDIRTLSVGAPMVASEISTAWFAGSPGSVIDPSDGTTHSLAAVSPPLLSISAIGFWDWISVSGSDDNQTVIASIPDVSSFASTPFLRLAGWNGTAWIDLSGSATASGNTENSTLSGTIPAGTTITALAIGSTSFILPVRWESFTAIEKPDCSVQLDWTTGHEENTDYFEVQRSDNGNNFVSTSRVVAAGNSNQSRNYQAVDRDAITGNNYYRIKQVDLDGKFSFSDTRLVRMNCSKSNEISIYPTVTNNKVTIELLPGLEEAVIRVLNVQGQLLNLPVQGSGLYRYIFLNKFSAGVYVVQVIDKQTGKVSSHKIVLQ